jgi:hypothetical protein
MNTKYSNSVLSNELIKLTTAALLVLGVSLLLFPFPPEELNFPNNILVVILIKIGLCKFCNVLKEKVANESLHLSDIIPSINSTYGVTLDNLYLYIHCAANITTEESGLDNSV